MTHPNKQKAESRLIAPSVTEGEWERVRNSAWGKDVNVIARQERAGLNYVSLCFVSSLSEPDAKMLAASKKLAEALLECMEDMAIECDRPISEWKSPRSLRWIQVLKDAGYTESGLNTEGK